MHCRSRQADTSFGDKLVSDHALWNLLFHLPECVDGLGVGIMHAPAWGKKSWSYVYAPSMRPLCALYAPSMRPLCPVYTPSMRPLCALYAPSMRPLCALYAPSMRPLCPVYTPSMRPLCALYAPSMQPLCALYASVCTPFLSLGGLEAWGLGAPPPPWRGALRAGSLFFHVFHAYPTTAGTVTVCPCHCYCVTPKGRGVPPTVVSRSNTSPPPHHNPWPSSCTARALRAYCARRG